MAALGGACRSAAALHIVASHRFVRYDAATVPPSGCMPRVRAVFFGQGASSWRAEHVDADGVRITPSP